MFHHNLFIPFDITTWAICANSATRAETNQNHWLTSWLTEWLTDALIHSAWMITKQQTSGKLSWFLRDYEYIQLLFTAMTTTPATAASDTTAVWLVLLLVVVVLVVIVVVITNIIAPLFLLPLSELPPLLSQKLILPLPLPLSPLLLSLLLLAWLLLLPSSLLLLLLLFPLLLVLLPPPLLVQLLVCAVISPPFHYWRWWLMFYSHFVNMKHPSNMPMPRFEHR